MDTYKNQKSRYAMIGTNIGDWYVDSLGGKRNGKTAFNCVCNCGTKKTVMLQTLRNGESKGCGCKRIERQLNTKPGHRMSNSKIYYVYAVAKDRCNNINNKRYKDYGGRGIKMLWNNFEDFYRDMGTSYKEGLSIDRINNDGNYCKENCRWATAKEQANNTRTHKQRLIRDIIPVECRYYGCEKLAKTAGYCTKHYYHLCGPKEKRHTRRLLKHK